MAKQPEIQLIKQRYGIIGNTPDLNRAIEIALQVAPTDLSVLIMGESGVGKETFPQVIHQASHRKHGPYIAVNCGSIPEGTIDSELFGHEKGSFTGAMGTRKGYFEVANGGTLFLDEVGELPLSTQARLLRVLETGEFMKVGSSKVEKTDARVVAATNLNMVEATKKGRFREDLYYRLNTVPIKIPSLRDRKSDIPLLFRKFASDAAEKYNMPPVVLSDGARDLLIDYRWPGNIRQLKNITEQISIIETSRDITKQVMEQYLPKEELGIIPIGMLGSVDSGTSLNEKEFIFQLLKDMRLEINDLKKIVADILNGSVSPTEVKAIVPITAPSHDISSQDFYSAINLPIPINSSLDSYASVNAIPPYEDVVEGHVIEEGHTLSLQEVEKDMIMKALERHNGKRKNAAQDLKISERTLYRKIKEYNLENL